ncbi:aminotransferase class I/II-fold pyridoxal phosphate-dependent enzyme [Cohnella sp. CFH 77786]|nr:aminotransferase class I/II-fold pyridoxal phosphate-dependent enzyme [Cohnella sp. CFH 77786]
MVTRMERGEWKAHDKLPSVRLLAEQYRVHRLTAFRACTLLKQHGKVYVKDKSGYYASPVDPAREASGRAEIGVGPAVWRVRNDLIGIQETPVDYQFSQALIDPNLLPNLYLSEYVKQVFDDYPKLMGTYSNAQGDEELRENLCGYLAGRRRIPISAGDMLITTGATQAIDLLSRLYVRPMDAVLAERPTYSAALDIIRMHGARLIPVDIRPEGYDLDRVEALMKRERPRLFYMNPTFQNPTGYTVPVQTRKRLVELAERYRCLLIEDDSFHEMFFDEPPPPPLLTFDTEGWVAHLRSFSKYVAPGLRVCAVVCRPAVMAPLVTAKSLADNGTPLVNQKIFLHYFRSERMRTHMEKLRIALQIRRDLMEEELADTGWEWATPKGGLSLWIRLPEDIPVDRLLEASLRASVSFVPGFICDPLREMRSFIRLSYSYMNESHLRDGVRRLVSLARDVAVRQG